MQFNHLHVHDDYSILDGYSKCTDYLQLASKYNMNALAITNHGNIDNFYTFSKESIKYNVKPIFGIELYVVKNGKIKDKNENRRHLTCLIMNDVGYKNIITIMNKSNLDYFYYKPRVDINLLLSHCEGLLFMTACISSVINDDWGVELIKDLSLKTYVYLEIMPFLFDEQKKINNKCIELSNKMNLKLIASNDVHYAYKHQSYNQSILLCMNSKSSTKKWSFSIDDLYFKSYNEMIDCFKKTDIEEQYYLSALHNTIEASEKCNFILKSKEINLPEIKIDNITNNKEYFIKLCTERLKEFVEKNNYNFELYYNRFKTELETIIKLNYYNYFLIVYDIIQFCKNNNIMVGLGRGSACGSLICRLLNITNVNPITYNLYFSRFLNESRNDYPDIDLDIQHDKKDTVKNYLKKKYGIYNVFSVSTFSELKINSAIRDVSRSLDIPYREVNEACINIENDISLEDNIKNNEILSNFFNKNKDKKLLEIVNDIVGKKKFISTHASAICISNNNEDIHLKLDKKTGDFISNIPGDELNFYGLVKFDILGSATLTIIKETLDMIKINRNINIDIHELTLDNNNVFEFMMNDTCNMIFQFTNSFTKFAKNYIIENFEDIVNVTALFRPGTLRSNMANEFVERKKGKQYDKSNTIIHQITKNTFGIFLFQEQVIEFFNLVAGLDLKICDNIRKIIAKSKGFDEFKKYKDIFLEGCKKTGLIEIGKADKIFDELKSFSNYSFNKSHAVAYSMISYITAYLKLYYFNEFVCANLNYILKTDNKQSILNEILDRNIEIRKPTLHISNEKKWIIYENKFYIPFSEINGVGNILAHKIITKDNNYLFDEYKLTEKYRNIIEDLHIDTDICLTDNLYEKISRHFNFEFKQKEKITIDKVDYKNVKNEIELLNKNIVICDLCNINQNKSLPLIGETNVFIIEEFPKYLKLNDAWIITKSNEFLMSELDKHDLRLDMFYHTSFLKCTKTKKIEVNNEMIKRCLVHLEKEIEILKPKLALILGNTAIKVLSEFNKEGGIINKNGIIEYSNKYKMYFCYSINPNMIYIDEKYKLYLEHSIAMFANKFKELYY